MNIKNQVKTETKTYTTLKLVSLHGVTIDPISVLIKERNLKPVKTGQSNVKYYDAGVLKQLWLHYVRSKPERDKTNSA